MAVETRRVRWEWDKKPTQPLIPERDITLILFQLEFTILTPLLFGGYIHSHAQPHNSHSKLKPTNIICYW